MRLLSSVLCCALFAATAVAEEPWVTIKGRVVFPQDKPIPKQLPLVVNVNQAQCLAKGPIPDESILVDPKTRGIKNVVVFLRPFNVATREFARGQIHPDDAKRKPAELVITQPCCTFIDRVTVARVGDVIVVNNPVAFAHNFFWASQNNGDYNVNVPVMGRWVMPRPLVAESPPIQYKCTIHGWMTGYVRIFNHPYYAVTDENGNFEIKNAPAGKFRIVYWHETGLRGGKEGRFGEPITIVGPTLEMKPVDFDVSRK